MDLIETTMQFQRSTKQAFEVDITTYIIKM